MWGFLIWQKTWPPWLKIEQGGLSTVFGLYFKNYKRYLKSEGTLLLQHQKLYKIRDIVEVVRWPLIGFTALYRPKWVFFHVFQLSIAYRMKNIADREKVLLAKMFSSLGSTKVLIGSKLSHDPLKGLWPLICEKIVFSLLNIQTSSPLKRLHWFKLNLVWCYFRVSSIELMWGFLIRQKTWPPWLKIEHRGKLQFFANNSKTATDIKILARATDIKILARVKLISNSRSTSPEIFKKIQNPM